MSCHTSPLDLSMQVVLRLKNNDNGRSVSASAPGGIVVRDAWSIIRLDSLVGVNIIMGQVHSLLLRCDSCMMQDRTCMRGWDPHELTRSPETVEISSQFNLNPGGRSKCANL